ncbi:hypothetical protein [Saccharibacillus sacchari]|uniref:Uncharacterized protein n=1 Tax=Saccharibacillus sacchari TaxID=456493 RepID=A0ACC6PDH0_9BACL
MTFFWILLIFVPVVLLLSALNPNKNKSRSRRGYHSGFMHDSGSGYSGDYGNHHSSNHCNDSHSSSYDGGSCDSGGGDGGGGGGGE